MTPASPFVVDWVREHAALRPSAPAIGSPLHGWTTYDELVCRIGHFARVLAEGGIRRGDIIVLSLPASQFSVAAGLAVQALGAILVEVTEELSVIARRSILAETDARTVITNPSLAEGWAPLLPDDGRIALVASDGVSCDVGGADCSTIALTVGDEGCALPPVPAAADDAALIVYTSGSTGTPRGVVQTHANIDANTRAIARYLALDNSDRAMATLPLFYCYGRSVLQTHLLVGGSVFLDDRFMYPGVVLEAIDRERCTGFAGVPLTFESLRRHVDVAALSLPTLRYVTQAGGRMRPETERWTREAFAPAELFVMYGQTEATSRISYLPPTRAAEKPGSVGIALDNLEIGILDESGQPQPPGSVGEIAVRGPSVTPGYFRAPVETAEILRHDWLYTGDRGYLDDEGFLFIVGRTRDFLKLGGYRVTTVEIEELLLQHPSVAEAAVVGVVGNDGSEQAIAVVVLVEGASVSDVDLRRHCRTLAPAYKVPRAVRFVSALPRTASNKVAKSQLRKWAEDGD
jgi:long-chain acyl-CoA synthetase